MKKYLIILLLFIAAGLYSQVTPSKVIRIATSTTVFANSLTAGSILCDIGAKKTYRILKSVAGTNSLSTLTEDTDYVELASGVYNHIENDTWFTAADATGTTGNARMINKYNQWRFGYPVPLESQSSNFDIGYIWNDIP